MKKDADFVKVSLGELHPNPYRDFPIVYEEERLKSHENSIAEKGFWNNMLIRRAKENGGSVYQIAYGHHRLEVLKRLRGEKAKVTLPLQVLSDEDMLKIMAEENCSEFGLTPRRSVEIVRAARKFLINHKDILTAFILKSSSDKRARGEEVKKQAKTWEDEAKRRATHAITQGIGAPIISEWLGKNWHQSRISQDLSSIAVMDKGELDEEAFNTLPDQRKVLPFVAAVKRHKKEGKPITKKKQRKIAKAIVEENIPGREASQIEDTFEEELEDNYVHKPIKGIEDVGTVSNPPRNSLAVINWEEDVEEGLELVEQLGKFLSRTIANKSFMGSERALRVLNFKSKLSMVREASGRFLKKYK